MVLRLLKRELYSELGGEGDTDGRAAAEEITKRAGWNEQLIAARDRHGAGWSGRHDQTQPYDFEGTGLSRKQVLESLRAVTDSA